MKRKAWGFVRRIDAQRVAVAVEASEGGVTMMEILGPKEVAELRCLLQPFVASLKSGRNCSEMAIRQMEG